MIDNKVSFKLHSNISVTHQWVIAKTKTPFAAVLCCTLDINILKFNMFLLLKLKPVLAEVLV